ncbi:head-tail adaptor [Amaricoccus macauensis]|uniref:Head-tail adaptor n=1 Tax=Amaricoccus macauensis TaxID=57001 RepID=A0A840SK34_9RHOB|nr:head-tail adaptor [Amaricoccus macauensis]
MSGAELSRRLTLEERVAIPDGAGGNIVDWRALGAVWAEVRPRFAREAFVGAQPRARVTYRIIVRSVPYGGASRPRPDQRFRDGARVFDILSVADRDHRFLEILAEEGPAQ